MIILRIIFVILFLAGANYNVYSAQIGERFEWPNGIVLLHSEKKTLPIVRVEVAIKAGSILEPKDKAGLSNLTAELLDAGTKNRSAKDISDAIEFVGGTLNTSGGTDYITVSLSILKKDIELGFDILSDIIMNPVFSSDELERQRKIIKNSIIQQKEDPGAIASKSFLRAIYGEHPYGTPVEGTEESIDRITQEDIVAFHQRYYLPNNTIMSVVGDINREELEVLISRYFSAWQKRDVKVQTFQPSESAKETQVIKINKNITQANIILGHAGISRNNPDYYSIIVMNYILGGGGFASRLMDNIRDNMGLAYDIHSYFSAGKYGGSFQVVLQTKNQSANTAIQEVLKEMNRMRTEPVSDRELEDAKSYLIGSFPLRIDSTGKIASFLTGVEFHELGLDYIENYKKFINAVTKDDILRVARKYLHPDRYTLVIVGDIEKAALRY